MMVNLRQHIEVHIVWLLWLHLVRSQICSEKLKLCFLFWEYNICLWRSVFLYLQPLYKKRSMYWIFRQVRFLLYVSAIKSTTANEQCRTEVNVQGMALKRSVFKRWSVAAPHLCDVKCGREIACQSYNYNRKYQICELNNRTKEARPENFPSAPGWFYIRRLNGRGEKSEVYVSRWFLFL